MKFLYVSLVAVLIASCGSQPEKTSVLSDDRSTGAGDYAHELCAFSYTDNFNLASLGVKRSKFRPQDDGSEATQLYKVTEMEDRQSGEKVYRYATFRDEDDGGNTMGWVESSYQTGRKILATIGDGECFDCVRKAPRGVAMAQVAKFEVLGEDRSGEYAEAVNLEDFLRSDFDFEMSTLEAEVFYAGGHAPEQASEAVAKSIWTLISGDNRFESEECGYRLIGDVEEESRPLLWRQNAAKTYKITGSGDGGLNTCTGSGGPGMWMINIEVEYHWDIPERFTIKVSAGSE